MVANARRIPRSTLECNLICHILLLLKGKCTRLEASLDLLFYSTRWPGVPPGASTPYSPTKPSPTPRDPYEAKLLLGVPSQHEESSMRVTEWKRSYGINFNADGEEKKYRSTATPHLNASSNSSRASSSFPSSFKTDAFTKRYTALLPTRKLKLSACSRLFEAARYFPCDK